MKTIIEKLEEVAAKKAYAGTAAGKREAAASKLAKAATYAPKAQTQGLRGFNPAVVA